MDGLLEAVGANKRVQEILICWTAPLFIGLLAFDIVVLPDVRHAPVVAAVARAVGTLHVNEFLFLLVASIAGGAFLHVNRHFIWRALEGYAWPAWLRRWRVFRAHVPECRWLQATLFTERAEIEYAKTLAQLTSAKKAAGVTPDETGRLDAASSHAKQDMIAWRAAAERANGARLFRDRRRKYPRGLGWLPRRHQPLFTFGRPADFKAGYWILPYPASPLDLTPYPGEPGYPAGLTETQIMPTLLGNAMRAMETYGANNYGLDSQLMWYDLVSAAPAGVQAALDESQFEANTLISGICTAVGLAAAATAGAAWRASVGVVDARLWVTAAVSVVVGLIIYRRLLSCIATWSMAVQTLVNRGRIALCKKYGLTLPVSPEAERRMWEGFTAGLWYGPDAGKDPAAQGAPSEAAPSPSSPADSASAATNGAADVPTDTLPR